MLAIDLDPQASLTVSLGLRPEELRHTINDALLGNISLLSVSRETPIFGLDLIPANQGLLIVDKILYRRQSYEFNLKRRLDTLADGLYDTILIDCPPTSGALAINAMTAADLLIIPAQCEYYAAHSLRRTVELARSVKSRTNPALDYRILVTMYDRRNGICRLILDKMQQGLSGFLMNTIIEVDTKLRESPVYSKPITHYAPTSRGAEQYRHLAQELIANELR